MKNILLSSMLALSITQGFSQKIDFTLTNSNFQKTVSVNGTIDKGDVDGDGDIDVFVSSKLDGNTKAILYLNDGHGVFTPQNTTTFPGLDLSCSRLIDIDGDKDLDLFYFGRNWQTNHFSLLYLNDGKGNFTQKTNHNLPTVNEGEFDFGDIDGDKDLDIIITGYSNSVKIIGLYKNNGIGEFQLQNTSTFPALGLPSVKFFDCDKDGDLDLIHAGELNNVKSVTLYKNDGTGIYTATSNIFEGVWFGDIAIGDSDNDGDLDVLISGQKSGTNYLTILYNNDGNGNFTQNANSLFTGMVTGDVEFADLDKDGDDDIFITGILQNTFSSSILDATLIYKNNGNNSYVIEDTLIGASYARAAIDDFNGDKYLDFIVIGDPASMLYLNNPPVTTAIDEKSDDVSFSIFPNPSSGKFTIEFNAVKNEKFSVKLISTLGQVCYSKNYTLIQGSNLIYIRSESLSKGIYMVVVENEDGEKISKKIIVN
jgi:predicted nucleotidyltransferase